MVRCTAQRQAEARALVLRVVLAAVLQALGQEIAAHRRDDLVGLGCRPLECDVATGLDRQDIARGDVGVGPACVRSRQNQIHD